MKAKRFLIVSALAAAVQFAPIAYAQAPNAQHDGRHRRHGRLLANLSPEERDKLRIAHRRAMADPAVQSAKQRRRAAAREFRDLRRAKMLETDPSIQPILEKVKAGRGGNS